MINWEQQFVESFITKLVNPKPQPIEIKKYGANMISAKSPLGISGANGAMTTQIRPNFTKLSRAASGRSCFICAEL
mgnify:CR=1 FL=1